MKVLLLEDDAAVSQAISTVLTRNGHSVEAVGTAGEASALLSEDDYDLAIVDIGLPDRSGIEILQEIKQHDAARPVVVISGGGQTLPLEVTASLAEARGADTVLVKPFDPDELMTAIQSSLAIAITSAD